MSLSNNATTPNTQLNISAGIARDSNNIVDINVGNYLGTGNASLTANSATVVNFGVNGTNGLDTGTIAASSLYYIYAMSDSSGKHQPSTVASLSATAPILPFGYDSMRLIGAALTDASSHLLPFYSSGNYIQFDAPVAVVVTATYSAMDLSVAVPATNFGKVYLQYKWTPAAAANTLSFQPSGAVGDYKTTLGIVAAVAQEDTFMIQPLLVAGVPKVSYKISAGTLNNVYVQGFEMIT